MPIGLLGRKLGMSQIFDKDGKLVPVTFIEAGPCFVLQKKTKETDGYNAIQLGFGIKKEKNTTKPLLGHFKKAGVPPLQFVREFRLEDNGQVESLPDVGQTLDLGIFKEGEHVDVIGISKGRGFASPIKRWHTRRGPETHGSMYHRRPGSQGASSFPSRTWKNKHAAGHMGNARCTALNLMIVRTDKDRNLILVKGSVPGHNNNFVIIRKTVRAKKAERMIRLRETAAQRLAEIAARQLNPLKASKKQAGGKK
ncbi:MAG: 50S ribosomal protein L3 [Candidatus Hydrogenedentota bacterium]|nr:50S ribosomal protein L3 [Candidatus Sumerlaea chitinivorans]RMH25879.1 MAG: 50S ribosomal protein L3 [Candidatus Hydrogenedentota bacterium]GIX45320.1 MAG: 50S ribosomal protein L3 [Candidatus Sumerlaea sp.]